MDGTGRRKKGQLRGDEGLARRAQNDDRERSVDADVFVGGDQPGRGDARQIERLEQAIPAGVRAVRAGLRPARRADRRGAGAGGTDRRGGRLRARPARLGHRGLPDRRAPGRRAARDRPSASARRCATRPTSTSTPGSRTSRSRSPRRSRPSPAVATGSRDGTSSTRPASTRWPRSRTPARSRRCRATDPRRPPPACRARSWRTRVDLRRVRPNRYPGQAALPGGRRSVCARQRKLHSDASRLRVRRS